MTQKMLEPHIYTCTITLKTGLHIGGSGDTLKIGGIDSEVVKNPLTWEPYIPGSSIKGKMRAMLEMVEHSQELEQEQDSKWKMNLVSNPESMIAKAFGCASNDKKIASKIIFEDFVLTWERKKKYQELKSEFFEDKAENSVPRFLSGTANPRHIERVPAGVEFEGTIVLVPEEWEYGMSKEELEEILSRGIELIESTYLWGGGSRGNGRVSFELQPNEEK